MSSLGYDAQVGTVTTERHERARGGVLARRAASRALIPSVVVTWKGFIVIAQHHPKRRAG